MAPTVRRRIDTVQDLALRRTVRFAWYFLLVSVLFMPLFPRKIDAAAKEALEPPPIEWQIKGTLSPHTSLAFHDSLNAISTAQLPATEQQGSSSECLPDAVLEVTTRA